MRQPNPNANKWRLPDGYRDLGWQFQPDFEIVKCREAKHNHREFDNSLYMHRSTDVVTICDECKIAWHIDMSD